MNSAFLASPAEVEGTTQATPLPMNPAFLDVPWRLRRTRSVADAAEDQEPEKEEKEDVKS